MHVLITADVIGGVWNYTRELVSGLLDRGHQITLVSFGRLPSEEQALWTKRDGVTYYPTEFPLEWMADCENGINDSLSFLSELMLSSEPDVLHTNQLCYACLECNVPIVVVVHSDVMSWWTTVHGSDPPPSSWLDWYRGVMLRGIASADVVITPSQWMLNALSDRYMQPRVARVIYNGRSAELFCPSRPKSDWVLSVGRLWDEGKQVSLLLSRDQPTPVRVVGSATHPARGAELSPVPQRPNVTMCGEQGEEVLREFYADAWGYIGTSRYEPFGLAPLEAGLSRCALIMNDIPTFREIWGDAAFYFRRNDAASLANVIGQLSRDAELREDYAARAYSHALAHYSADRMVGQYEEVYRALLDRRATA